MPSPISLEIRNKIVEAYQKGVGTQAYIAEIFGTTRRTVNKLINMALTGNLAPKKQTGRPSSIDHEGLEVLKDIVLSQPDKTLAEYCELYEEEIGVEISVPVMCRALKQLNLRRKKKSFYAQEQDRPDVKKKEKILWRQ